MAISTMSWKVDTCNCIFEQTHNPADSGYGVQFSRILSKCSLHAAVADQDLYGVVTANANSEMKRKNRIENYLLTTALGLTDTVTNNNGETVVRFKAGVRYDWSFNANRQLVVSIVGVTLTTNQKNTLQTWCNTNFGSGLIIIN